jgi:exopolysaccharide production protein ExoY
MVAAIAIMISLPLVAVIAIIIFIQSRQGPLVRHSRVGWRGNPLGVLKFRTMWDGTESPSKFFSIEEITAASVPVLKTGADSRVSSRFAAFCRRHSLDEIPQLYHVARGDMSLVGPRPLTAAELKKWYGASAETILTLRPGLTGLWQVKGRNRLTYPQRRRLDIFLARRASAGLYFLILMLTVPKVLFGADAW